MSALLLEQNDLPPGYSAFKADEGGGMTFCGDLFGSDGPEGSTASAYFQRGLEGDFIIETLRADPQAEALFEGIREGVGECETFSQTAPDGDRLTGRLETHEAPPLGDESFALRLVIDSDEEDADIHIEGELVLVRAGTIVCVVGMLRYGELDSSPLFDLVATAVDRLDS